MPTSTQNTWTLGYEDVRMQGNQQATEVREPKDMRMWACEDTNKHPEYTNLRIRGCGDTGTQVSTHEPEDMRM